MESFIIVIARYNVNTTFYLYFDFITLINDIGSRKGGLEG